MSETSADMYAAVATVSQGLGGEVVDTEDIGSYAIELAALGWEIFPLRGKVPAITKRIGGRGVLDATSDCNTVARWWGREYRGANIGGRVPMPLAVLDIDPRHSGDETLAELEQVHGPLPPTLTSWSGRGDGGRHLYFLHPGGQLTVKELPGIDLKTHTGYVVLPPSLHPDTGKPYRWDGDRPVRMLSWLVDQLRPAAPPEPARKATVRVFGDIWDQFTGPSIADAYSNTASWCDLLPRHGWRLVSGDGDSDGSCWRHPAATSMVSATVKHGCLFVYSPNTLFPVTEASDPHGVTRFRGLAILDYGGDMSAAARAAREQVAR